MTSNNQNKKHPTQIQLATAAARHVELENVHLGFLSAKCAVPHRVAAEAMLGPGVEAQVDRSATYELHEVPPALTVTAKYRVALVTRSEPASLILEIESDVVLRYVLDSLPPADERDRLFEAFSSVNGIYNSWPYFREIVQSTCARMALPPVVLPVYRVPRPSEQEASQSDPAVRR